MSASLQVCQRGSSAMQLAAILGSAALFSAGAVQRATPPKQNQKHVFFARLQKHDFSRLSSLFNPFNRFDEIAKQ